MAQDPKKSELEQATLQFLANKLFCEFMTVNEKFHAEPEHFFEDWIDRHIVKPDEKTKLWIWRYFMENLISFRKFKKTL